MAVPLHAPCGRPIFLPPGFTGALCDCRTAASSPASTQPERAFPTSSSVARDGGRGASDNASGSPGREPEKGSQRSPQGQGGAKAADPAIQAADPSKDDREAALDFYAKRVAQGKKSPSALTKDEFFKLVDAAQAMGQEGGWKETRDWLKGLRDGGDAAVGKLAKVFAQAGFIRLTPLVGGGLPPLKELEKKVYDWLKANAGKEGKTIADLVANVDPKVSQALVDRLVDGGFLYQPLNGTYGTAI